MRIVFLLILVLVSAVGPTFAQVDEPEVCDRDTYLRALQELIPEAERGAYGYVVPIGSEMPTRAIEGENIVIRDQEGNVLDTCVQTNIKQREPNKGRG